MNSDYKAGFEAGIRAAVAVCRELERKSINLQVRALHEGSSQKVQSRYLNFAVAQGAVADLIAALTPEETDA